MLWLIAAAALSRGEVNQRLAEHGAPWFWRDDANKNGMPDTPEMARLWGPDGPAWETALGDFDDGDKREQAVLRELGQSTPALVYTDVGGLSKEERGFVAKMLQVGELVDQLYDTQVGATELERLLPADLPSRALFFRNHGPWCAAPATEKDPYCNAIPSKPQKLLGLYPSALQAPGFCDKLLAHPHASALFHPFSVVRGDGDALRPVPYHIVYSSEMEAIGKGLRQAADLLPANEVALKAYLQAAAQAFRDNQWHVADDAWVKTAGQTKWYVRIAPDEVYADPCSRKALFQLSFGLRSESSQQWQTLLEPHKQAMEDAMAAMAGAPYKARNVTFRLPDFIDVVLNAGDARQAFGATVGQSLPIFGKVAKEGRKRTIAMANLYVDADSIALQRRQAESVLCSAKQFGADARMRIMSTVLHEASHNLGPIGFYQVDGKTSPQIFGNAISLMLSELHAQTGALFFSEWLLKKNLLKSEEVAEAHVRDLHWAFDQISRSLTGPYGQLGAIQVGWLLKEGGLAWKPNERSASGEQGCVAIEKLEPAIVSLAETVSRIKAKGDRKAIEELIAKFTAESPVLSAITERYRRFPKVTFVYAVDNLQ